MAYIGSIQNKKCDSAATTGGEITVNVEQTKYTAGTPVVFKYNGRVQEVTLPAGAYTVSARTDEYNGILVVDGEPHYDGGEYNAEGKIDHTTCTQEFLPAIEFTSNEKRWVVTIIYPASSGVTKAQLRALTGPSDS